MKGKEQQDEKKGDGREEGSRGKGRKEAYVSKLHLQTPYCDVPWYSCHPVLSVQICCALQTCDADWQ